MFGIQVTTDRLFGLTLLGLAALLAVPSVFGTVGTIMHAFSPILEILK